MAGKDNKRKRDSADADRPSKKSAASSTAIKVQFPSLQDELHPVIASSPGLNIPSTSFKTFSKPASNKKNTSETPTPTTHSLLLHSSAHPKLDYTANQEQSQNQTHYIAVYDQESASLKVLPAHPVTLRTTLRSEAQEVAAQNAARTFAQQREDLGMAFGTKKARKALAARYENAITSNADYKDKTAGKLDAVESAVMDSVKDASAAMPAKEELQDSILASKPIPKPNLQAQKVEEAYPLSTLVPSGEMRALAVKDWQDAVESNTDVKTSSRFVASRLSNIVKSEDVPKLKALKYLLLLIDFLNALQPGRGGKKVPQKDKLKAKMSAWPDALIDSVRRRFADSNELNKWHLDNLMTHMAAISLYIDHYRTDTHDLREDLRLENKQMSQYFMELGCRVANPTEREQTEFKMPNKAVAAQRRIAKLKLPLDFPKTRLPPRRR